MLQKRDSIFMSRNESPEDTILFCEVVDFPSLLSYLNQLISVTN